MILSTFMPKMKSKQAKKLAQKRFNEIAPIPVDHSRQLLNLVVYVSDLERNELLAWAQDPSVRYLSPSRCGDWIEIHQERDETDQEQTERIQREQQAIDSYNERKNKFYAEQQALIEKAEAEEQDRRAKFNNPEYIEFLKLSNAAEVQRFRELQSKFNQK